MEMQFDHVPQAPYLATVLDIIRKGIANKKGNLKLKDNEDIKNQKLSNAFNVIGTQNEKLWIGASQEHKSNKQSREDIYFYLNDGNYTRIFYIEGKRLPKSNTISQEEYVSGISTSGKPSGGIERYKLGIHGEPQRLECNGLIAYIENKTIDEWETIINNSIVSHYPGDLRLLHYKSFANEYTSTHRYSYNIIKNYFKMHHFWIDLTE